MEITEHVKTLAHEGELLAEVAERAGTDAAVPTCPGWRVTDLLRHTGSVHRWATAYVAERRLEPVGFPDAPELVGAELLAWFREGHADLVRTLSEAPADVQCWTFLPTAPPSPVAFWARRQAHETAVHRMDAEAALGVLFSAVEPEFAEDGVDELLTGFHARPRSRVRTAEPKVVRVRAADTGAVWTVHLSVEPARTVRGDTGETADCELIGEAAWLYEALWNRIPLAGPAVSGDLALARLWTDTAGI
ncbi:maleylpyruvate isomerase family mycothiol-dependent enzyme [Streptomyces virginiae]|uniref:maleylpyruvate isomerase family mycothiol-dependent enzyme n=1 Tax=Streptomyces virginiae TaxID=1961 RepID=UPI00225A8A61|nr:maleylpyruvate isomerase family mycothiol-dependent enzyme [Streptomyces virginiae]MCX4961113.1 maleylpyruvate isomerase family mycothiol-dependent enzyme [Streptomyces virginiae]MCX5180915.1 maleylpyruvate isomerase family mycothiol-dependent enzyme [Streptomyces virginiae]